MRAKTAPLNTFRRDLNQLETHGTPHHKKGHRNRETRRPTDGPYALPSQPPPTPDPE